MTKQDPEFKKITTALFQHPHATMGYMHRHRPEGYEADSVKALFNHASRPQPADLASMKDDEKYQLSRFQKAGLFYQASRKSGDNIVRSVRSWIYGL